MPPVPPGNRWANKPIDETDIERTPEYIAFIEKLTKFVQDRGTDKYFSPEPELGRKKLDLLKLYERVVEKGGYDVICDEKSAWRNMAQDYKPIVNNTNAGFLLKTIYYKCLVAYEMVHHWKKEPPPPSILEDQTAAGGNVLNRTLENYTRKAVPESDTQMDGTTPTRPRRGSDDSPAPERSAAAQSSGRILRDAPPRRVMYQPEVATPKARGAGGTGAGSPAPSGGGGGSTPTPADRPNGASFNGQSPVFPAFNAGKPPASGSVGPAGPAGRDVLTFGHIPVPGTQFGGGRIIPIPVRTPLTMPQTYRKRKIQPVVDNSQAIGFRHPGPSAMHRIMMAIKCPIPEEVEWGLFTLLKFTLKNDVIFSQWPVLAEAVLEHLRSGYNDRVRARKKAAALPGASGSGSPGLEVSQNMLNAALILRNLALNRDNAQFLAQRLKAGTHMCKCLKEFRSGELRQYLLDITESIAYYMDLTENRNLLKVLFGIIPEVGRSEVTVCLKALAMIVIRDDKNSLEQASDDVLKVIIEHLYLPDESVVSAALDFFYQFTSFEDNSTRFLMLFPTSVLSQLCRLCTFHAIPQNQYKELKGTQHRAPAPIDPPRTIVPLPKDIVTALQGFAEPERATKWMRCLFEQDEHSDITQIQLWQAYQARFNDPIFLGRQILPAADFIKNVSVAFKKASAMVVNNTEGNPGKFIIKGIRPRLVPLSIKGEPYIKCKWTSLELQQQQNGPQGSHGHPGPQGAQGHQGPHFQICGQFAKPGEDLYFHLIESHCQPDAAGKMVCRWGKCYRFHPEGAANRREFLAHILTHIPTPQKDVTDLEGNKILHMKQAPEEPLAAKGPVKHTYMRFRLRQTQRDEKNELAGVPYVASLVLRNLARTADTVARRRYGQVVPGIWKVFEENTTLRNVLLDCLNGYTNDNSLPAAF